MRMRSPSSAPPERRRVGSIATTANAPVGEVREEAVQQLVGDGALAGAAGAGDTDHRNAFARAAPRRPREASRSPAGDHPVLERRQHPRHGEVVAGLGQVGHEGLLLRCLGALDEVVDHPGEAEPEAVIRRVDALDAVRLELGSLGRSDRAAAAAEDADVAGAGLAQHVDGVRKYSTWPPW